MEQRELGSPADRPRRLLHPHPRLARRSRSPAHRQQHAVAFARRRQDLGQRRRRLRRLPRHLVGHATPAMAGHYIVTGDGGMGIYGSPLQSDRQHQRVAADRADVSRDGRSAQPVLGLRQPAGRRQHADREQRGRSCRRTCRRMRRPAPAAPAARGRRAAAAGGGGGRGGGAPAAPAGGEHAVVRIGLHLSRAEQLAASCGARATRRTSRRSTRSSGLRRSVSPWMHTLDSDPVGLKYRCQWSPPLAIDWFDNSVYFGCQVDVPHARSRPDVGGDQPGSLDRRSEPHQVLRRRRRRQPRPVLWRGDLRDRAVAHRDRAWCGSAPTTARSGSRATPARLDRSRRRTSTCRRGASSAASTRRTSIPAPPTWRSTITSSTTAIRICSRRRTSARRGRASTGNLPKGHPLDYTLSIAENPRRKGMVFAGTGHGFFYSRDDGKTWKQFKDKLPAAPVNWIEVPKNAAEVAVATYGRGTLDSARRLAARAERHGRTQRAGDLQLLQARARRRVCAAGGNADVRVQRSRRPAAPITIEVLGARRRA